MKLSELKKRPNETPYEEFLNRVLELREKRFKQSLRKTTKVKVSFQKKIDKSLEDKTLEELERMEKLLEEAKKKSGL